MTSYDWRLSFQNTENNNVFEHQQEIACDDVWTEHDEMSRESTQTVATEKVYTARTVIDLLNFAASKTMKRAKAHFYHGIAENLDDPKYAHYRYWSNPLETKKG
nr:putative phospholipid:diacylglycerol acyltransferase 2 isoform X2 [Arachis hypogaea]